MSLNARLTTLLQSIDRRFVPPGLAKDPEAARRAELTVAWSFFLPNHELPAAARRASAAWNYVVMFMIVAGFLGALRAAARAREQAALADGPLGPTNHARSHQADRSARGGDLAAARAAYEDFLLYWRDDDHPVPERAEAEAAVKRLSAP